MSGPNHILRPLFNSNRGKVTINKWSQNLIWTTRIVRNGYLGMFAIFKHKMAKKCNIARNPTSSGPNQILRPLFYGERGIVNIIKCSQNLIWTIERVRNGLLGVYRPQNA